MATIELADLRDRLDPESVEPTLRALAEAIDASETLDLAHQEDARILDSAIDDDVFVDFRDRLEANDLDADLYVPVEFEEVFTVAGQRIASTYALQLVLESLREDFFVDDEEEDDDEGIGDDEDSFDQPLEDEGFYADDDSAIEMKDEQLRHVWRRMYQGTRESLESNLCLFLHD